MKFKCQVDIARDRATVIEFFDNPDNMQYWQDDFISFDHQDGEPGMPGATSIIKYKRVELLETILERNLPDAFHGSYEGSWGKNTMYNYFEELGPNQTRWRAEVEYVRKTALMMKLMATLFPSMFRKQTQKWMDQFKYFVESKT